MKLSHKHPTSHISVWSASQWACWTRSFNLLELPSSGKLQLSHSIPLFEFGYFSPIHQAASNSRVAHQNAPPLVHDAFLYCCGASWHARPPQRMQMCVAHFVCSRKVELVS